MSEKIEKVRLAILRILQDSPGPIGSSKIAEQLFTRGHEVSTRTVRYHLLAMDRDGLTENLGRRGRRLTVLGCKEVASARVIEKVGYLTAKIDQMTYRMNFDLSKKAGTVVINISIIEQAQLRQAIPLISQVYANRYAMGQLVALFGPGEWIGEVLVPEGSVGIGTVCSITLNGILLTYGIPTHSRFGGLLELQNRKPRRFVELIHYAGTTLDPLEVFIRSGMTDYTGATETGNGRIGVSFREMPAESREHVIEIEQQMEKVGLGAFLTVGWPGQPLLEIPVSDGQIGAVVIGGLNPVAILEEQKIRIYSRALAALVDYKILFHYRELDSRVRSNKWL